MVLRRHRLRRDDHVIDGASVHRRVGERLERRARSGRPELGCTRRPQPERAPRIEIEHTAPQLPGPDPDPTAPGSHDVGSVVGLEAKRQSEPRDQLPRTVPKPAKRSHSSTRPLDRLAGIPSASRSPGLLGASGRRSPRAGPGGGRPPPRPADGRATLVAARTDTEATRVPAGGRTVTGRSGISQLPGTEAGAAPVIVARNPPSPGTHPKSPRGISISTTPGPRRSVHRIVSGHQEREEKRAEKKPSIQTSIHLLARDVRQDRDARKRIKGEGAAPDPAGAAPPAIRAGRSAFG